MSPRRGAGKWLLAGVLLLAGLAALGPAGDFALTLRLLRGLYALARGHAAQGPPVVETRIRRTMAGREVEAVLYRPAGSPAGRAVVLVPGVSELGCNHPRLAALARILAGNGFLVVTPDIPSLREFRIEPEAVEAISFWHVQMRSLEGGSRVGSSGLAGISFSGTLALIAAAQAEAGHAPAFVLAVGAYSDLGRCIRWWLEPGPVTAAPGNYPTRYYGRWVAMLAALDLLPEGNDRRYLAQLLRSLLLQKEAPPESGRIGGEAARWRRFACAREDEGDPQLAQQILAHLLARDAARLSPDQAAAEIACPIFLAHGAYDDLIPPAESLDLERKILRAPCHLIISPFLTHTHPAEHEPGGWEKARASLRMSLFLYRLVRATR